MSKTLCSRPRYVWVIFSPLVLGMFVMGPARATCYSTPGMAVAAVAAGSLSPPALNSEGYRVTRIQTDQVTGQRWAMVANCAHPEWPSLALQTKGVGQSIAPQAAGHSLAGSDKASPVVRAGDIVRVWKQESLLRIEVTGVSEENGSLGKTVRVRLSNKSMDDLTAPKQVFGVVRGPSDVEIQL